MENERADTVSEGWICMYTIYFECGLRLPLPPLLIQCMHHYQLAIPQLMLNGMRVFLGLIVLAGEAGIELSVDDILAIYYPQENSKDKGRYSMYPRRKKQVVGEMKNADRYWQDHYFFMHVNEKSMGGLANAFYPLWGTLRNELKKPPPKALLFEEKLERLLALLNREWDDIHTPKRLRASSLWKDFVEIPSGIAKRVPSWKKAAREAAKAAAAAAAKAGKAKEHVPLPILESSPEPSVKPASPPAKKRKAVERGRLKIPAKRSKKSKVATPETDVEPRVADEEDPHADVDLSPSVRLLEDKKTSVRIMNQLLSDADAEMLSRGSLHSHLDDLLWDGLKTNIRAMGLLKRTSKKISKQKARIAELEVKGQELEERESQRECKLLDIERKFGDVKACAEDLIGQLQNVLHEAKEGSDMMKVMGERYDEATAKIRSLEADNARLVADNAKLVADIVNEYSRATLKARYDLLKEYKQGLLVDAEVDEEIQLYDESLDEAGTLSSAPAQESNEPRTLNVELPVQADPSSVEPSTQAEIIKDRDEQE
ncbi:hypothetical protein TIFTF001_039549 [Ficus carica]|uniref:Uncharacterized protein n=1 Tax=Ficus carica TaxID=3494 RepID=A0AA88JFZ1_FICCA|nr:hypothetical protein TIFTF001_039549 [Ficus carica]